MNTLATPVDLKRLADEPEEIERIGRPTTANPSVYFAYAKLAEYVADAAENRWDQTDERIRHAARLLAGLTFNRPKWWDWRYLRSVLSLSRAYRQDPDAVAAYLNQVRRARNSVLEAIERENPDYQQAVTEALREAVSLEKRESMTAGQASEWIRSIRP